VPTDTIYLVMKPREIEVKVTRNPAGGFTARLAIRELEHPGSLEFAYCETVKAVHTAELLSAFAVSFSEAFMWERQSGMFDFALLVDVQELSVQPNNEPGYVFAGGFAAHSLRKEMSVQATS
jgi:hypothetical protein